MSRGTVEENRRKFGRRDLAPVLVQDGQRISERYSAVGTPSAIVVRLDGRIGSSVAAGPEAIKQLIGNISADKSSIAPDIRLQDLDGRWVTLADFRGTEALVLFWDPDCGFCQQMLPDLRAWERGRSDRAPQLLLISTGTPEQNRALGLTAPIVLDPGFAAGRAFGAGGTPSAVLVDREGRIRSRPSLPGAQAVLTLAAGGSDRSAAH